MRGPLRAMVLGLLVCAGPDARAQSSELDPTVPRRLFVGAPPGTAPMHRLDERRSGRSSLPLPVDPVFARGFRLSSDLAVPPVLDGRGRMIAATTDGTLSATSLDKEGAPAWSLPLGASPALGPVVASDGTAVTLTDDGELVGAAPDGTLAFRIRLPDVHGTARAAAVACSDGTVALAVGSRVFRVGRGGDIEASADTGETIVALAGERGSVFATTDAGTLLEWKAAAPPTKVGSFGGPAFGDLVGGAPSEWLSVVSDSKLVAFDLRTHRRRVLFAAGPDAFVAAPVVLASGELRFLTRSALVGLARDRTGMDGASETVRLAVPGGATAPPAASVPLLTDSRGTLVYAAGRSTVTVVLPSHDVRTAVAEGCGVAVGLLPSSPGVLAMACRSGFVGIVRDRSGNQPALRSPAGLPVK